MFSKRSKCKADTDSTIPITSITASDIGDKDEHWVAELFTQKNSKEENKFEAWYKANEEILMLNALREENQGRIAEWLGCGNDFNDEIELASSAGH